jgi:hypothetical protein
MSGGLIFVVIFVVIFVGSVLLNRATNAGMAALFRNTLFRGTNKTADALVKNALVFKTQANFDALKKRIYNEIVPPDRNASWPPVLYLAQAGKNAKGEYVATFRRGTKSSCSLEVQVKLRHDSAGVVGSVDVTRWRELNGGIMYVNDMKLLRRRVEEILLSLDPHAQLSHRSAPSASTAGPPNGFATFNTAGAGPVPPPQGRPAPRPAQPPRQSAPPPPTVPQQGSRYAVPDTSSWVERGRG